MQVFHSLWDTEAFYVWAESSNLPLHSTQTTDKRKGKHPQLHPFALPESDLTDHLDEIFSSNGCRVETLALRLPGGIAGPLPSPWLLREDYVPEKPAALIDCTVSALAFDAGNAVDLLLDMPLHSPPGTVHAESMRFWQQLALFSLELVTRQQFVPALREDRALWKAVIDENDQLRAKVFFDSIPPSCLSFSSPKGVIVQPQDLVSSFINGAVDYLVRSSLAEISILPSHRGRPARAPALPQQFLKALCAGQEEAVLKAPLKELSAFSRQLNSWTDQLRPQAVDVPFRTCFRLEAPAGDEKFWRLGIFVQAKEDPSLLISAEEIWKTKSSALTFLQKRLKNPQEQLLADLGIAVRLFPSLEECLEKARPTCLDMQTEEAYSFLRETAPLLKQNGFGVLLPSWWQRPESRLGVKLHLKDAAKREARAGPGFFGLDSLVKYDWQLSLGENALSEAEFSELSRLKVPLVQIRGEWIELRSQDVEAAIAFFRKNRGQEMTMAEALRLGLDLSRQDLPEADSALPLLGVFAQGRIDQMLKALSNPGASLQTISPPQKLQGTLRPYQLRGVSWLEFLHRLGLGACLADDMGLGKTVELIAFLLRQRENENVEQQEPRPTLLVCPLSVAGNWQKEMERFAPSLRVLVHHGPGRLSGQHFVKEAKGRDVVITTYALAARDEEDLSAVSWSHLVLDEAQSIKNHAALQTQSIKRLPARHRIALTGTPVENRLSELWSIMDFLNPGYLGSSEAFRKGYVLPIEKYRNNNRSEALRSIISPFILRRLKTDPSVIQDLPEKMEMKVNYNLTSEQASLYAAVVEDMLSRIESLDGIKRKGLILAALTKLKQICNHPALFLQDASSLDGRSGKLSRLEEMLYEAAAVGDRSLIFTQFAAMGAMLRHHLQEKLGVEALFLHGKTPRKKRDEMIARFSEGRSPIFILSLKAGGYGLNLTAANQVFHFDRWWNPAVENQATDRAFRIGQKKNVFVHKFVCLGTLEERIDQMIERKKALADSVIGTGESWLTELSNEALRDMLSLRQQEIREIGSGGEEI
ncbi:MAG: DEAD/DEAH box helicase [Methanotrichaceae archaeon]|nr:DEAD/DEAH box helicase [Methanotrichaceae archaeon]